MGGKREKRIENGKEGRGERKERGREGEGGNVQLPCRAEGLLLPV